MELEWALSRSGGTVHFNKMLRASRKEKGDTGSRERKINRARSQRREQESDPNRDGGISISQEKGQPFH